MALGAQVVNFIRSNVEHEVGQILPIGQVAIMQEQLVVRFVRVLVNVIDPVGVESAATSNNAMDFIAFFEQQFRQVGSVLTGDPGDKCLFGHLTLNLSEQIQLRFVEKIFVCSLDTFWQPNRGLPAS